MAFFRLKTKSPPERRARDISGASRMKKFGVP
jgi:hypothetical protein